MNELFFKSFVIPFHKAFLGFFILVILVFGVFMELKQHLMIAERLLENTAGFYSFLLVFLLYAVAQQQFQRRLMNGTRFRIFHQLAFLSFRQLNWNFLPVWLANHAILLLYASLLTYVGFEIGDLAKLPILWGFLVVVFLIDISLLYSKVKKPFPDHVRVRSRWFKKLNFEYWFLMHLRENRTMLILAVKLISIILLNGFFYSFHSGDYDLRWLEFGLLCACYAHFPIWLEKNEFESEQLTYFQNMPVRVALKLRQHSTTIIIILLPELILLIYKYGNRETLLNLAFLLLLFLALNMGIFGLIKIRKNYSNSLSAAYLVFFILFILVIFGVHPIMISMISLIPFFISIRSSYSV
ncbi:hypothetical protein LV84_03543 [Algoriphagus ratkowskyi]|uniref:ABC-2 type transport system permease protein n=1 Tax=Algoriphagus ratkowskyi TaxID=57028 RepID=A0A2W7QV36_9BACT|nr:hypothetical protein [Algoriphagus ratkowskyi]PZX52134.1 hypothetical protein LV84_03543 [Algoriphagus ratkowskyi]TXD76104.1 hypothetical protein ESW18_17700 [Algoriphagus ratkowskyi]